MKHTITKLGEENEFANSILGNYLTELELRYHASEEAGNMIDTRPDLLQFSQANGSDCRSISIVLVSKIAESDHG